ncbi:hypothetical protein J2S00_002646 [Caldalkalibacillus uzonensis]|uniref:Uncharacterized protein n=1 Tax=Caldalkalibacillus uzonensis TaxID=353224 RepID=A0ABU0CTV0_9BACI|nr:hypothetical protein [Caldalkalibacillus uzonensis]
MLLIEGLRTGFLLYVDDFETRNIDEPDTETVVRGSREGFVESVVINMTLLRRRIRHPSLRFELFTLGTISQTPVALAYIQGLTDPIIVSLLRKRLNQIKVDSVESSGEVEQYVEDNPYTIFPR